MNNSVKKVVFYSTRQIQPYFSDRENLLKCDSLIRYFSKLDDDFSHWLSDLAFLTDYLQKMEEVGEEQEKLGIKDIKTKLDEVRSILFPPEDVNPHTIRVKALAMFLNGHKTDSNQETDAFWNTAFYEYVSLNKTRILFDTKHFEEYQNRVLSGNATHLNRDLTESNNEKDGSEDIEKNSLLKHRLGIYHKEEGEYAVAAVWPWPKGDTLEPNHDENWRNAIVEAIKELYPNSDEIILVIHDWDLDEWKGKDQIVFRGRPLPLKKESNYNENVHPSIADPCTSLIVFQHTNRNVINPLLKDRENRLNSPKQVWEAMGRYLKRDILRKKDEEKVVETKHNEAID